jgi:hypothetical protein
MVSILSRGSLARRHTGDTHARLRRGLTACVLHIVYLLIGHRQRSRGKQPTIPSHLKSLGHGGRLCVTSSRSSLPRLVGNRVPSSAGVVRSQAGVDRGRGVKSARRRQHDGTCRQSDPYAEAAVGSANSEQLASPWSPWLEWNAGGCKPRPSGDRRNLDSKSLSVWG